MYNKSLDTASIESMRKALAEVEINESDRAKHYKGATPPEDMKNNRKGKGAQDMMKPADDAVANPAADEQDMVNKDAAKMTANVKVAKKRRNDKDVGDKDIVEPGTPMKDPAVVKPPVKEAMGYGKPKPGQKVKKEDMDNKMFVLRKQAQLNQRRIDKGMKPYTPLHPDHKNLIKPMKKKKANEEKEMVNIKPRWILDAYKEMYKDALDENILSRLTGGHGRYMKKLKAAHDHHDTMMKAHSDMEHHIDPSAGSDPDSNRDPDHQYVHGQATQAHYHAREAIKKLAAHAKKNKLTSHPKGSEYKDAKESSAEANENSRDAISRDRSNKSMGRGRAPYRGPYSGYASKNYDTHPATVVSQNFVKGHRPEYSKTKTDHHKSLD